MKRLFLIALAFASFQFQQAEPAYAEGSGVWCDVGGFCEWPSWYCTGPASSWYGQGCYDPDGRCWFYSGGPGPTADGYFRYAGYNCDWGGGKYCESTDMDHETCSYW